VESLAASHRRAGPVLRGRHSLWRMLEYLESVEPGENTPLAEGLKSFCIRNTGKGVLVLITDLMDKNGYQSALRFLLTQQMDVYVIHVLCPEELDPPMKGDLKLIDCEDAEIAEITISQPLLERYRKTLASFIGGAREFCSRRGMTYMTASTQTPVETLVLKHLRQRGLVR
jgi:hypothetical protein